MDRNNQEMHWISSDSDRSIKRQQIFNRIALISINQENQFPRIRSLKIWTKQIRSTKHKTNLRSKPWIIYSIDVGASERARASKCLFLIGLPPDFHRVKGIWPQHLITSRSHQSGPCMSILPIFPGLLKIPYEELEMWPLYLLLNKFLGAEDNFQELADGHLSLVQSYPLMQSVDEDEHNGALVSYSHYIEVPHINQVYTWDCGLACVLMVLRALRNDGPDLQELKEFCCSTSIWTVDLAYMLKKFSVNFFYFTVTLGANPSFSGETFYKEQLPNDLVRVNMLFQRAREAGILIQRRSISAQEISSLILSGKYIAIALLDQYKLRHSWIEDVCLAGLTSSSPGYTGHYVVICGYDAARDEFEIRDPASSRKDERVKSSCLEEARKSFGTDEDLLLISLEKDEHLKSPSQQLSDAPT